MNKSVNQDKIEFHSEKGIWKKFFVFLFKSHLPWGWIVLYLVAEIGVINIGLDETAYTAQLFAGDLSAKLVSQLIFVMIVNGIGGSVVILIRQLTNARFDRNARQAALNKIMHLPMSFFKEENPRETITRIVTNTQAVGNTFVLFVLPGITGIYSIYAVLKKVSYYDQRLVLTLIGFIPLTILIGFVTGRINYSLNHTDKKLYALLTEQLSELITNIPLAKAFAKEKYEEKRSSDLCERLYHINIKGSWLGQIGDLSFSVLTLIQEFVIILVGLFLLGNENIELKAWIAFYMFSGVLMTNIQSLLLVWQNVKTIQGGAKRITEIMDTPFEINQGQCIDDFHGTITFDDVHFQYKDQTPVLSGINCSFAKGKATALLGVSGCGKSTIVNLIDRIYMPQSGTITIDGVNIQDYELEHYRKHFSFISQDIMLFSGTIKENLCYGLSKVYSDEELWDVLKKVQAYDFVQKLPGQLYEEIGEYGNTLSGGQRQKLALARVLLDDAPYMILDEATASMDMIGIREVLTLLKTYANHRTIIAIAHSPEILTLVQDVIIIENGCVSAQGSLEEVKKTNQFLKDFMREGE